MKPLIYLREVLRDSIWYRGTPQTVNLPMTNLKEAVRVISNKPYNHIDAYRVGEELKNIAKLLANTPGNEPVHRACRESALVVRDFSEHCSIINLWPNGYLKVPADAYHALVEVNPLFVAAAQAYYEADQKYQESKPGASFGRFYNVPLKSPYTYGAICLTSFAPDMTAMIVHANGKALPAVKTTPRTDAFLKFGFIG